MNEIKPDDIAKYMLDRLQAENILFQDCLVMEIKQTFGDDFIYVNENGNFAISKKVLTAFSKLKKQHAIVWDNYDKCWRLPR